MSQTVEAFKSGFGAIMTALEGTVEPANKALSDGAKRGIGLIAGIEAYGTDITREKAASAIAIINGRIATVKAAVNALEPIDFDTIWPEEAGGAISEVIAGESEPE